MSLIINPGGAENLLRYILNPTYYGQAPSLYAHLFATNYTPTHATQLADMTTAQIPIVSYSGYAPIKIDAANWNYGADADDGLAFSATPLQWNIGAGPGVTIYGYYVTDAAPAYLYWSELLAGGPFPLGPSGGVFTLSLPLKLTNV